MAPNASLALFAPMANRESLHPIRRKDKEKFLTQRKADTATIHYVYVLQCTCIVRHISLHRVTYIALINWNTQHTAHTTCFGILCLMCVQLFITLALEGRGCVSFSITRLVWTVTFNINQRIGWPCSPKSSLCSDSCSVGYARLPHFNNSFYMCDTNFWQWKKNVWADAKEKKYVCFKIYRNSKNWWQVLFQLSIHDSKLFYIKTLSYF